MACVIYNALTLSQSIEVRSPALSHVYWIETILECIEIFGCNNWIWKWISNSDILFGDKDGPECEMRCLMWSQLIWVTMNFMSRRIRYTYKIVNRSIHQFVNRFEAYNMVQWWKIITNLGKIFHIMEAPHFYRDVVNNCWIFSTLLDPEPQIPDQSRVRPLCYIQGRKL